MKFLVDAQLPRQLARHLATHGHDAVHTLDLPDGNRTSDRDLRLLADREARMVVTKGADFVDTHLLAGSPRRLLLISTGNIASHHLQCSLLTLLPCPSGTYAPGTRIPEPGCLEYFVSDLICRGSPGQPRAIA